MSSFWFIIKQQWTTKKKYIFSNSSHLEWRAGLSDTILKWDYPRTIPAKFGLIWFSGFREDLNVIFYQNMPNLHNWYKSAERKISQKNPEYFDLYQSSNGQLKKFLFLVTAAILNGGRGCWTQFWKGPTQGPSLPGLV